MIAKQNSGSHMLLSDFDRYMHPMYLWLVPRYKSLLFGMRQSDYAQTTRRPRSSLQSNTRARIDVGIWKSPARSRAEVNRDKSAKEEPPSFII